MRVEAAVDIVKQDGCLKKAAEALAGKRALVVGLASTGIAAARFLKKCGAVVTASDVKPIAGLKGAGELVDMGVTVEAGADEPAGAQGAEMIVVSPGVPCDLPFLERARSRGAEVISEVEFAYRFMDAPVVAIAGTNGKTTTTTLLGRALEDAGRKVFVGGNIGTPAIEYVEGGGGAQVCVLEISSFHLETTAGFNPHVGVLLNITEDHLDRYRDFAHYARTKFRLFENQGPGDYAVVNMNDPVIAGRVKTGLGLGRVVPFTVSGRLKDGLYLDGDSIVYAGEGFREVYGPVSGFGLQGLHNMENIMAVVAAARLMGVGKESLLATLGRFKGLSHRMEVVRELDGVVYVDDSKGTNIGALMMALRGVKGPVVLIAGGRDKGGNYGVLKDLVKEKVRLMVLIGEARLKMERALGPYTGTVMADTLEDAVRAARGAAKGGDTVLLCPACSSFDMFKSYKERGERFRACVEAL